ncbi:MAG: YciI-like protein [Telluria sp.]
MHYLLCYDLAPDYLERRAEFRNEHLKLAWESQQRGEMVLAGALADPADQAMLLFSCESPEAVERFAKTDPYVTNGLVTGYRVRQWNTVVGDAAFTPVRPGY